MVLGKEILALSAGKPLPSPAQACSVIGFPAHCFVHASRRTDPTSKISGGCRHLLTPFR